MWFGKVAATLAILVVGLSVLGSDPSFATTRDPYGHTGPESWSPLVGMVDIFKTDSLDGKQDGFRSGADGAPVDEKVSAPVVGTAVAVVAGFEDLGRAGVHRYDVEYLDSLGFFDGTVCGLNRFCPREPLQRWVMAVWLVRAIDGENPLGGRNSTRFSDVSGDIWWAPYVERLADLEVTKGCGPERFCPDEPVTRGQMASFLKRGFRLADVSRSEFVDVGPDNVHRSSIETLAALGITAGCDSAPARYCPLDDVTRAQMATFIGRTLRVAATPLQDVVRQPLANEIRNRPAFRSGSINIPVYYCAAKDAGYTSIGLQAEVSRANELVGGFFFRQSGGKAQINFIARSVVSPSNVNWDTGSVDSFLNRSDDPCLDEIENTRSDYSDPRIVILADITRGPTSIGYAFYGGRVVMPTLARWDNDSLGWADTLAHEIGHSVLELPHTFDSTNPTIPDDVCSLMSYCGPPDISRVYIADQYCELLGWSDPPGTGCPIAQPRKPPDAPVVTASATGDSIYADWSANDNDAPIEQWDVEIIGPDSVSGITGSIPSSYTWEDLSPGSYLVRVRAYNEAGWSPWGIDMVTVAGNVPGPPTDVRAVAGDGGITVSWSPPTADSVLPIAGYNVDYYSYTDPDFDPTSGSYGLQVAAEERSAQFTGFKSGHEYWFTVVAWTATTLGTGSEPVSAIFMSETKQPPGTPMVTATLTGESIEYSWWANNNGPPIDKWEIHGIGEVPVDTTGYISTVPGPGLYTITVRAHNEAGWGPWGSAQVTVTRSLQPPDAPVVTASATGNSIYADWSANGNGTPIDRWEIDGVGEVSAGTTGYTWTNQRPGSYTITVRAHNEAGWSPWGSSNTVTVEASPSVRLSRGDPGPTTAPRQGDLPCARNTPDCRWLRIELRNFQAGRYRVYCAHDGFRQHRAGFWRSFEFSIGSSGSATFTRECYINISSTLGRGVIIYVAESSQPVGQYRWTSNWLK